MSVISSGSLSISSGVTSTGLEVIETGIIRVLNGGWAETVSAADGGSVVVSNGGILYLCTVAGGTATVLNGGWAEAVSVENGGLYLLSSGASMHDARISGGGSARIGRDVMATGMTVLDGGVLHVDPAGYARAPVVSVGGAVHVSAAGIVDRARIYGSVFVSSGGSFNSSTVNSGGTMTVFSGGTATEIKENGGYVHVADGANVSFASNTIHDLILSDTAATVHSGTTANGVTVDSGGILTIFSGGELTGRMTFESGAIVSAFDDAILNFDLTRTEAGEAALVNDLSIIQGMPVYTLTVDGTEADGIYSLADGAESFAGTISVMNTEKEVLCELTVGETVKIGDSDYTLNLSDGTLSIEVVSGVGPVPAWTFFSGDFNGDGFDMLAAQKDSSVTVYMNGEPGGAGLTLEDGWKIAGVGDFNGDGFDDFLRVNDEGYVVGEMSNGDGTFAPQVLNFLSPGWSILGTGDFNGNGTDDVLIANPTAASETVGLLGYWESGTTWTLINGYSAEWECVATGDCNGDGKCDMLWRNSFEGEGGLTYNAFCTWIVDDPVDWRMVSVANPAEWNFLCSGDFDGDKMNDIAMINDIGVVGIWGVNDGYLSSWSILSAVTPEWTLAGVADFNADGTDDIAWCNPETGQVGAWQIENKELAGWQVLITLS